MGSISCYHHWTSGTCLEKKLCHVIDIHAMCCIYVSISCYHHWTSGSYLEKKLCCVVDIHAGCSMCVSKSCYHHWASGTHLKKTLCIFIFIFQKWRRRRSDNDRRRLLSRIGTNCSRQ